MGKDYFFVDDGKIYWDLIGLAMLVGCMALMSLFDMWNYLLGNR